MLAVKSDNFSEVPGTHRVERIVATYTLAYPVPPAPLFFLKKKLESDKGRCPPAPSLHTTRAPIYTQMGVPLRTLDVDFLHANAHR